MLSSALCSSSQKGETRTFGCYRGTLIKMLLYTEGEQINAFGLITLTPCVLAHQISDQEVLLEGTVSGNKSICGSASKIPLLSTTASKCHSYGNMRCQCSLQNDFSHASFMDLTLERSVGQDRGAFIMDHEVKSMLTSTMCKSDPESDVAGSSRKKKDWKGRNKKKHQGRCHWVSIHIMKVRIHIEDCICMKAMQILMHSILGQRNAKAPI